jgi:hypothetical protein
MEADAGILFEELFYGLSFMCRKVIQHDVKLFGPRVSFHDVGQESDKFGAGVTAHGFAVDLPGLDIQRGVKRQRTVSVVFESCFSARPGDNGSTGSRRPSAWRYTVAGLNPTAAAIFRQDQCVLPSSGIAASFSGAWPARQAWLCEDGCPYAGLRVPRSGSFQNEPSSALSSVEMSSVPLPLRCSFFRSPRPVSISP